MSYSLPPKPFHSVVTVDGMPTYKGLTIQRAILTRTLDAVAALMISDPELINRDFDGTKLIHTAAAGGNIDIFKMMVRKGGDINEKGPNGATPLLIAAQSASTHLLNHLIDSGADIHAVDDSGLGLAHYAIQCPVSFHILHSRIKLDIPNDLLHHCCRHTHYLGALYCIEQLGLDVNNGNPSPLEIASQQKMTTENKKLINALIDNGGICPGLAKQSLYWEYSNVGVLKEGSPLVTIFAFLGPNLMLFTAAEYFPKLGGLMVILNFIAVALITKTSINRKKPDPALAGWYFGGLVFGSFVLYTKVLKDLEAYTWAHILWYAVTGMMAVCYTKAFLGDPGEVVPTAVGRSKFYNGAIDMKTGDVDGKKYCARQHIIKPLRAKYCSTTGKLVHRFDHYCVWTCNAIGGGNIQPFYLFAIFQIISQLLVAAFTFTYFKRQYSELPSVQVDPVLVCLYCDFFFSPKNASATLFLIAYNTAVLFFISAVVAQQTFFISRNVTSNDVWFPERYSWTMKIGTRVHTVFDEGVFRNFKNFILGRGLTDPPDELPTLNDHLSWKISRFTAWTERRRQRLNKFTGHGGLDPTIQVDDAGLLVPGGLVRTMMLLPWAQRRDLAEKQAKLIQSGMLQKDGLSLAQFIESEINPNSVNAPLQSPSPPQQPQQVPVAPAAPAATLRTASSSGAILRSASSHVRPHDV